MTRPLGPDEQRHDDAALTRALPHDHEESAVFCERSDGGCVAELACACLNDCALSLARKSR